MMEFGLGLWGMQATRMAPRQHANLYREMIEDCQHAEELGFHSVWLTEHHFWYEGWCPSLLVGLRALAAATRRIKIATGSGRDEYLSLAFVRPGRARNAGSRCDGPTRGDASVERKAI